MARRAFRISWEDANASMEGSLLGIIPPLVG